MDLNHFKQKTNRSWGKLEWLATGTHD